MYFKLVFQRHDGSRVTAQAPAGGIRRNEYLFSLRERRLAMRSAALGHPPASTDRPTGAASTDQDAALPAAAMQSRRERWIGGLISVTVLTVIITAITVAIQFGSELLVGDDQTADPEPPAITAETASPNPPAVDEPRVYWEDLQPGMCGHHDPTVSTSS
jgi:hypothetical protein